MKLSEFAQDVLFGEKLESKLQSPENMVFDKNSGKEIPINPGRCSKIAFSEKQLKFPKKNSLQIDSKRALALHFFANHELLAIEMMAAALLCYPSKTEDDIKFKKGILSSLKDEQKHFKLYLKRMNDLGVDFGDFPLNDFFWRQMKYLKTPESFFALMSMTFEMANLDFCLYYKDIFEGVGDQETAKIMEIVLEDEITHVSLGRYWLEHWKPSGTLWEYYKKLLPEKITPARAKGVIFSKDIRIKAGISDDFITCLDNYSDNFSITERREWKSK